VVGGGVGGDRGGGGGVAVHQLARGTIDPFLWFNSLWASHVILTYRRNSKSGTKKKSTDNLPA
jgi:hypothetical protein